MQNTAFETNTTETDPEVLLNSFFLTFGDFYKDQDEEKIRAAWDFLIQKTHDLKRKCGKPYYLHPMRVACVLAESRLGADAIIAGLFHNILEVDPDSYEQIKEYR